MQRSPARPVILTGTIRPQYSGPQPTMTGGLEDAGVYKRDEAGQAGFVRFLESIR